MIYSAVTLPLIHKEKQTKTPELILRTKWAEFHQSCVIRNAMSGSPQTAATSEVEEEVVEVVEVV